METKFRTLKFNDSEYKIAYNQKGSNGPIIFYIHGWSHSKRGWNQVIEAMPETYTQVALDMPGFGESTLPKNFDYTIESYSKCIESFIESFENKRYAIVGHSMGGLVTLLYLDRNREQFSKVGILGSPIEGLPFVRGLFHIPGLVLAAMIARYFIPDFLLKYSGRFTIATQNLHKISKEILKDIRTASSKTMTKALRNVAFFKPPDFKFENKNFLLVRGDREVILTKKVAEKYKDIFNADLFTIPGVSHIYMIESPEEFVKIVTQFLTN